MAPLAEVEDLMVLGVAQGGVGEPQMLPRTRYIICRESPRNKTIPTPWKSVCFQFSQCRRFSAMVKGFWRKSPVLPVWKHLQTFFFLSVICFKLKEELRRLLFYCNHWKIIVFRDIHFTNPFQVSNGLDPPLAFRTGQSWAKSFESGVKRWNHSKSLFSHKWRKYLLCWLVTGVEEIAHTRTLP